MKKIFTCLMTILAALSLSGCTLFKLNLVEEMRPLVEQTVSGEGADKILLIDISGFITTETDQKQIVGRKQPGIVARVREELDLARQDKQIRAVILRINSPGGGVTPSDTLYHELIRFKADSRVPMIAHVMDIGTSGAYYAALAADRITAQPTSVTGSIGVIMFRIDATGLMEKLGVQSLEISSGSKKGMASPFRPISPEERAIFQKIVDSLDTRFVNLVAASRKLNIETAKRLADGRVYTSRQAQEAGLIDSIGYLDDAVDEAKKLAGLTTASVVTYTRPGEYRANIYSMNKVAFDMSDLLRPGLSFLYLP